MERESSPRPERSPAHSPSFRHVRSRQRHSPVEIKERMRKSYKDRIHNSRSLFMGNMRGAIDEVSLRNALSVMLNEMFGGDYEVTPDDEEYKILEKIKEEIIEDEMHWLLEEYDKANMDNVDWSALEQTNDVICPTCQKVNLVQQNSVVMCPTCNWRINSKKNLSQLKIDLIKAVENHSQHCNSFLHFTPVPDSTDVHIYSLCDSCGNMTLIL